MTPLPARQVQLTRDIIVDAAEALFDDGGREDFSLRELGEQLGVHATAVYRHFKDKRQLLQAVADRTLVGVGNAGAGVEDPFAAAAAVCQSLRSALLQRPSAARVLSQGPTRQPNEVALTERLLGLMQGAGLSPEDSIDAYHALIEYTVGSAIIDQPLASITDEERAEVYRRWRADYLGLDENDFPHLVRLAPRMYRDASSQFTFGLTAMLDALRARAAAPPPAGATAQS
jgi:TetR/AcrR family transcriptional regulator, tetracycline repressor protein